jgi:hypothetical protein
MRRVIATGRRRSRNRRPREWSMALLVAVAAEPDRCEEARRRIPAEQVACERIDDAERMAARRAVPRERIAGELAVIARQVAQRIELDVPPVARWRQRAQQIRSRVRHRQQAREGAAQGRAPGERVEDMVDRPVETWRGMPAKPSGGHGCSLSAVHRRRAPLQTRRDAVPGDTAEPCGRGRIAGMAGRRERGGGSVDVSRRAVERGLDAR